LKLLGCQDLPQQKKFLIALMNESVLEALNKPSLKQLKQLRPYAPFFA
jgi:hypothetical protein